MAEGATLLDSGSPEGVCVCREAEPRAWLQPGGPSGGDSGR